MKVNGHVSDRTQAVAWRMVEPSFLFFCRTMQGIQPKIGVINV